MAITRAKKETVLAKVRDILAHAGSVVFVRFTGLTVADANTLRKELRKEGVSYAVIKKTLLMKGLAEAGFEGEVPNLEGAIAVAYGEDSLAPARGVATFGKTRESNISIEGGVFEKSFKNKVAMQEIARIPSLLVLRAQFVQIINSPLQKFAVVLDAIAKSKAA